MVGAGSQANTLRLNGRIKEIFTAQAGRRLVVDCGGFELIGVGDETVGLIEGATVAATLEPSAIHVIAAANSR